MTVLKNSTNNETGDMLTLLINLILPKVNNPHLSKLFETK